MIKAWALLSVFCFGAALASGPKQAPAAHDLVARTVNDVDVIDVLIKKRLEHHDSGLRTRSVHHKKRKGKKCKAKNLKKVSKVAVTSSSAPAAAAASTNQASTTAAKSTAVASTQGAGLFAFENSGATEEYPNGSESWLNGGIGKSNPNLGWNPPANFKISDLKTVTLEQAYKQDPSTWSACYKYANLFEKYGSKYGLPPMLLASIALQESSCDPTTMGDSGGACGLMQITEDKWEGRGKQGCQDPDFNISAATEYLKNEIDNQGSFLIALAAYNGWYKGMTYSDATKAANSGCCECQQNLDYLFQVLNGYLLGRSDAWQMGSIRNLDVCGGSK